MSCAISQPKKWTGLACPMQLQGVWAKRGVARPHQFFCFFLWGRQTKSLRTTTLVNGWAIHQFLVTYKQYV